MYAIDYYIFLCLTSSLSEITLLIYKKFIAIVTIAICIFITENILNSGYIQLQLRLTMQILTLPRNQPNLSGLTSRC